MELKDLIRHIENNKYAFCHEGGNLTIYKNLDSGKMTSIPRHREIKECLAKKIWDDLGVLRP